MGKQSYNAGREIAQLIKHPAVFTTIGIVVVIMWMSRSCAPTDTPEARKAQEAQHLSAEKQAELDKIATCNTARASLIDKYNAHMAAGRFMDASGTTAPCATVLGDIELKTMTDKAFVLDKTRIAKDTQASLEDRIRAITLVAGRSIEGGRELAPLKAKLERAQKQQEDKERRATAALKRSQGVVIGMSPEDAMASSWGKPESINRTVYSFGVHEQWVYGGGNYLYFKDGVLETIQTGN